MGGAPLLLALAVVSIDYGYQPDGSGGLEYIIQVPPQQILQGNELESVIPPDLRGKVSRVVIRMGKGTVPRDDGGLLSGSAPGISVMPPKATGIEVHPPEEPMPDQNPMPIPTMSLPLPSEPAPANTAQPTPPNTLRSSPTIAMPGIETDSSTSVKRPQNNDLSSGSSGLSLPDAALSGTANQYAAAPQSSFASGSTLSLPPATSPTIPSSNGYTSSDDRGWQDPSKTRPLPSTSPNTYDGSYANSSGLPASGAYANPSYASNTNLNSNGYGATTGTAPNYGQSGYGTQNTYANQNTYGQNTFGQNSYGNGNNSTLTYANDTRPQYPNSYGNSLNDAWGTDSGMRTRDNTPLNTPLIANNPSTLSSYGNTALSNLATNTGATNGYGSPQGINTQLYGQQTTPTYGGAGNATTTVSPILPDLNTAGGTSLVGSPFTRPTSATAWNNTDSSYYGAAGRLARQPFSHRFLDGILLFSLIVNVYLIIAISRLITRHRDLVASVRGTALTV